MKSYNNAKMAESVHRKSKFGGDFPEGLLFTGDMPKPYLPTNLKAILRVFQNRKLDSNNQRNFADQNGHLKMLFEAIDYYYTKEAKENFGRQNNSDLDNYRVPPSDIQQVSKIDPKIKEAQRKLDRNMYICQKWTSDLEQMMGEQVKEFEAGRKREQLRRWRFKSRSIQQQHLSETGENTSKKEDFQQRWLSAYHPPKPDNKIANVSHYNKGKLTST